MSSTRTQIYLTAEQRAKLDERMRRRGVSLAQLVREALDAYFDEDKGDQRAAFEKAFGTMPKLNVPSRDEWDRG